jgi:hypothetical protein
MRGEVDHTVNDRSGARFEAMMASCLERMISTQMSAYPESWPEADKREVAKLHLFGREKAA